MFPFACPGEEAPWQKNAFEGYINGDGSSIEEAVIIRIDGLQKCLNESCYDGEFSRIIEQEHAFLEKSFGVIGQDWRQSGETNMEVDIEQDDKFYDKVAIILLSTGQQRIVYFDITQPYKAIKG